MVQAPPTHGRSLTFAPPPQPQQQQQQQVEEVSSIQREQQYRLRNGDSSSAVTRVRGALMPPHAPRPLSAVLFFRSLFSSILYVCLLFLLSLSQALTFFCFQEPEREAAAVSAAPAIGSSAWLLAQPRLAKPAAAAAAAAADAGEPAIDSPVFASASGAEGDAAAAVGAAAALAGAGAGAGAGAVAAEEEKPTSFEEMMAEAKRIVATD